MDRTGGLQTFKTAHHRSVSSFVVARCPSGWFVRCFFNNGEFFSAGSIIVALSHLLLMNAFQPPLKGRFIARPGFLSPHT